MFEKVYQLSIIKLIPQVAGLLNEEMPLEEKLRNFAVKYLELIKLNPDIPLFILHEMNKNPGRMKIFMLHEVGKKIQPFINQLLEEKEKGNIVDLPAEQIMANIMSLLIFQFIARPVFQVILNKNDSKFEQFIDERINHLPDYLVSIILNRN